MRQKMFSVCWEYANQKIANIWPKDQYQYQRPRESQISKRSKSQISIFHVHAHMVFKYLYPALFQEIIFFCLHLWKHTNFKKFSQSRIIIFVLAFLSVIGRFSPVSTPDWIGNLRICTFCRRLPIWYFRLLLGFCKRFHGDFVHKKQQKIVKTISAHSKSTV